MGGNGGEWKGTECFEMGLVMQQAKGNSRFPAGMTNKKASYRTQRPPGRLTLDLGAWVGSGGMEFAALRERVEAVGDEVVEDLRGSVGPEDFESVDVDGGS
jgi:hypothetical protein